MACILKTPQDKCKGILCITSLEKFLFVDRSPTLQNLISSLKDRWIIGVHYNSPHADLNFIPGHLFDFYMAGPEDLVSKTGENFYQLEMDCSNFCPDFFEFKSQQRSPFWDVLLISRNVGFKSLNDFLEIAKKIISSDSKIRVLGIISHEGLHGFLKGPSNLIKDYLTKFTLEERRRFTILTPSIDYPFPFDLETLAHFYHSSRIFLHVAEKERHPRVVAYAWSSGMPVVSRFDAGSLLPKNLKAPPGFYSYETNEEAASIILKLLKSPINQYDLTEYSEHHLQRSSIPKLKKAIQDLFQHLGQNFNDNSWYLGGLDIRLARHHFTAKTRNSIGEDLTTFLYKLKFKNNWIQMNPYVEEDIFLEVFNMRGGNTKSIYREIFIANAKDAILRKFNQTKIFYKKVLRRFIKNA